MECCVAGLFCVGRCLFSKSFCLSVWEVRKRGKENVPWSLRSYLDGQSVGSVGGSLSLGAALRRRSEIFD